MLIIPVLCGVSTNFLYPFEATHTPFRFWKSSETRYCDFDQVSCIQQSFFAGSNRIWSICWLLQCRFKSHQPEFRAIWILGDGSWNCRCTSDCRRTRGICYCFTARGPHETVPFDDTVISPADCDRLRDSYLRASDTNDRFALCGLRNSRSSVFLLTAMCTGVLGRDHTSGQPRDQQHHLLGGRTAFWSHIHHRHGCLERRVCW